jgi:phage-related minor tail protein
VKKYEEEKKSQEARFMQQYNELERLKTELLNMKSQYQRANEDLNAKNEEISVLKVPLHLFSCYSGRHGPVSVCA